MGGGKLINAVDCAVPHPGIYPGWASVVCGYVGGHTEHAWILDEVNFVRNTGRKWWGIWTARNHEPGNPPLTAQDGITDSTEMLAALPAINYTDKLQPIFYDIEPTIYDLDPNGAMAAVHAFKAGMVRAGWLHVYYYTVARQGGDWIAAPTGIKPNSIPSGKVGVQYGGDANFDYDVFLDSLIIPPGPPTGADMYGYYIFEPIPNNPRYWIVALDLSSKIQVPLSLYNTLVSTGHYTGNPGFDELMLSQIPDVTVR